MTRTRWVPVAIAAVLLLGAGVVLGAALYGGGEPERGGPSPVDVGFARDMIVHHQQAVDMAAIAGPRLRGQAAALAEQIRASQQREIGQLQGWLTAWGKPVAGGEPMTWMTHDSNHGERGGHGAGDRPPMPGMASMPELQRLGELTGTALQSRFCQLMLRHHHGGVAMAEGAAERAARPYVRAAAAVMAVEQRKEMGTLAAMLRQLGGKPLPAR